MDILTAHEMLAARPDFGRSLLPEGIDIEVVDGLEPIVPLATAEVSLSGMLDDAETDADLDEAAEHFRSLLGAGVFTLEQWTDEAHEVIQRVIEWGDEEGLELDGREGIE